MEERKKSGCKTSRDTPRNFTKILTQIFLAMCALYSLYSIFNSFSFATRIPQKADRGSLLSETVKRQH